MSSRFEIAAMTRWTEEELRRDLDLEARSIEPELARAEGVFRGNPVVIETRAYEGPRVRYARFATIISEGLEIGNGLCLSRPEAALPIFGADLVCFSADGAMLAADLSPVLPPGPARDAQLAPLAERSRARAALPPGGELPGFCAAWFSPYALFTRIGPAEAAAAAEAYSALPRAFVEIARAAPVDPPAAASAEAILRAQAAYLEDHRVEDKGLRMLGRLFGQAWADRYVARVLFPEEAAIAP